MVLATPSGVPTARCRSPTIDFTSPLTRFIKISAANFGKTQQFPKGRGTNSFLGRAINLVARKTSATSSSSLLLAMLDTSLVRCLMCAG